MSGLHFGLSYKQETMSLSPTSDILHLFSQLASEYPSNTMPSVHPAENGSRVQIKLVVVQVGLRVPTPLAEKR